GVIAVPRAEVCAFVSWPLLTDDPDDVTFNVYRRGPAAAARRRTEHPIAYGTYRSGDWPPAEQGFMFNVRPGIDGREEGARASVDLDPSRSYLSLPLQTPEGYTPNDASVGDLDGDGAYELVIHQVGRGRDNSQNGVTTEPIFEAYELDGTLLWRVDL